MGKRNQEQNDIELKKESEQDEFIDSLLEIVFQQLDSAQEKTNSSLL